jgi:hypothetical protein
MALLSRRSNDRDGKYHLDLRDLQRRGLRRRGSRAHEEPVIDERSGLIDNRPARHELVMAAAMYAEFQVTKAMGE